DESRESRHESRESLHESQELRLVQERRLVSESELRYLPVGRVFSTSLPWWVQELVASYLHEFRTAALDPRFNRVPYYDLGNDLFGQRRLDEAAAAYRKALKFQPDNVDAHLKLSRALTEQKKFDEAVASCRKAIRLQPSSRAYYHLGNALQKKSDEATA